LSDCARCLTPVPAGSSCSQCGSLSLDNEPDLQELRERLARTLEGRYEITRLLGRGGMAVVFLAHDLVLERQVAIKVLPPDMTRDPQLILRFQQEAKTAGKLDHPNIIPIYRVESEAGLVYIVMKYISGHSLEDLLARGPLPIPLVRHILREAALALGHAHRRRVVHRDVKPANIMVDDDGRVILTDFGISKAIQGSTQLTGSGTIIGTPHYMAPEQARGQEVDGRADQYSLAIVAHRVLTGKPPFEGDAHSILYQQVFESPPSLRERRPDTPSDLRIALERALAKDAKARFATMEDFAAAVSGERSGQTTAVSAPAPVKVLKGAEEGTGHGAGIFVALATAVVIIVAAWLTLPTLHSLTDGKPGTRSTPAPASSGSKAPAASRQTRRQPAPVTATPARKASVARLKAVQYALLKVDSDPRGMLYVDGVRIGLTPIANHRLPTGTHRLKIERKGYQTRAETIVVRGTGPVSRRYDLRRR
jgi:eukaryotic-like serine/threonine-protein kinase